MLRQVAPMIQIAFEPAYDPYHTAFRFLLQGKYAAESIQIAKARIVDIFVLEPFRIERIRVPNSMRRSKSLAVSCQPPFYGQRPSTQSLFNQARAIQDAALQTMALRGLISLDKFELGQLRVIEENFPKEMSILINEQTEKLRPALQFLLDDLGQFPFDGRGGMKDRTQLGEFKYDVV